MPIRILYFIILLMFAEHSQAENVRMAGYNNSQPIEITADSLEIIQIENKAIFKGDVQAKQGDLNIRSDEMTVHYKRGGVKSPDASGANPQVPGDASKISKVEVDNNVFISTQKETAKGDHGFYDVDAGVINLMGDVTLTSVKNIVKGHKLVYNLKSGQSKMVSGDVTAPGGKKERVRGVFVPNGK
jgi:lipopolysaccharide export system protein LptA